jgi:ketosteroid isomerase-like protein
MAIQRLAYIALTLTLLATQPALKQSTETSSMPAHSTEANEVADTIRAMYAAAQKSDLEAFHALVTPGFYAFDNGKRFDGDALMRMVIDLEARGARAVWTVNNPDVHIDGNHAWIAYLNVGSLQMSPAAPPVPMQWLESAELEKDAGKWKIAFFHSTAIPAETPPPAH